MCVAWSKQQCLTVQVNFVDKIEGGVLSRNLFWLLSIIRPWHFEKTKLPTLRVYSPLYVKPYPGR